MAKRRLLMKQDILQEKTSAGISSDAYRKIIDAMIEIKEDNLFREDGDTFAATEGMIPYIKIRSKLRDMVKDGK
jgi:replicative DNA helicase